MNLRSEALEQGLTSTEYERIVTHVGREPNHVELGSLPSCGANTVVTKVRGSILKDCLPKDRWLFKVGRKCGFDRYRRRPRGGL